MSEFKILCVDDESDILEIYETIIGERYNVLKASSADEAIELVKKHQNQILYIFSDYKMPEKTGIQLQEELIQKGFEIPFAIITGNYDLEMATKAMALRISAFIEKPINYDDVFRLISDQGEKRKQQLAEEQEMVCSFISESTPMIEEIEGLILILEENPRDINALNTYFRLLHTIKGTASCVGLKSLPKFTHAYEDLVSLAKDQKIAITPKLVDSLLYGLDRLKFMYQEITQNNNFEFQIDEWIVKINSFHEEKNSPETVSDSTSGQSSQEHVEHKKSHSEKLPIPLETLDSFLELSGELTILRSTIYKAISRVELKHTNDKDIETLSSSIDELHKITSSVQKQISEMRKIGAENITRPLRRVVRDMSKDLQKDVDLKIHNENIKVDNTIAKIMSNSLVHLIRNSIDHGIEATEVRKNSNKNAQGTIELTFLEDGDNNIVILKDDGAGINKKRVLEKAIEKKIVTEKNASLLSNSEVFALIFEPGFSTAQIVSNISGRGVGMDMVKSSVESIGGKIHIESAAGVGTTFTLTLPQPKNVLINKTLMIEEDNLSYSIPIDDVVEVVKVTRENFDESVFSVASYPVLKRYEEIIPIFKLENCLNKESINSYDLKSREELIAIIIRSSESKIGIIVDKVHDIEESVIRKIRAVLDTSPIYSGVTYFGDDDLALVLNIENITKENIKAINQVSKESNRMTNSVSVSKQEDMNEYFTFKSDKNHYGIDKNKVFRIEILNTSEIQVFYGNYYIKYRDSIIKIFSLNPARLSSIKDNEVASIILIKDKDQLYALYIDEFYEFITSTYRMESHFSKDATTKGSIIHEDQIIYIVDDVNLDKCAALSANELQMKQVATDEIAIPSIIKMAA